MSSLVLIDEFDSFENVRNYPPETISASVLRTVRTLDERDEMEPFIRSIVYDSSSTPHGPAEIVDILTHKVLVKRKSGLAAFILKGKSFPKVRPHDVAHQIYRLEKIENLDFAVFAASGTVLDAAKEQFCSTAQRVGCKYALFDAMDLGRLFVAYGFVCPRDGRKIVASRCRCGYSPRKRILNLLQQEALKLLSEAHQKHENAGLVILPPSSGKTRIAAEDVKRFGAKRVLYVAHTHDILNVAQSEFEAVFGKKAVQRYVTGKNFTKAKIVNIATIQLLAANTKTIKNLGFDYLVIDEFHHAAAPSYLRLLDSTEPDFLLGLTATPFRSDRQDILRLCNDNVIVDFELRAGIDMGILAPYQYYGCFDDIDYSSIRHNGLSYYTRDLERALVVPKRDAAVIRTWRQHADGKPTLAFCCSHLHAERVAQHFRDKKIPSEVYISSTSLPDRKVLIDKLANGDVTVLCVVDVMNEGADLPFVECLLFLRPTESQRIFYQQLGRGLRKYSGKSHCTVIDFIGNFKNAYKIVDYQGLLPDLSDDLSTTMKIAHTRKEVFNLPLGCEVHFDDRVIDILHSKRSIPGMPADTTYGGF